jgi:hypothetical protein
MLAGTFAPSAFAHPIIAKLQWAPNNITTPGTPTVATFGVDIDADCPSGQTFAGVVTVTTPGGAVSTYTQSAIACGSVTIMQTYPTGFTNVVGTGNTNTCGVYTATWAGTTSALVGGFHPIFNVQDNFVVSGCTQSAPEFGAPAMLVAAIGLVLVAAVKRGKLLTY